MKPLLRAALRTILILLGLACVWLTLAKLLRRFLNFPAPAALGSYLDSDVRRFLQPPRPIIERSGIERGMNVLEIGCGSGAYTAHVAQAVGAEGTVAALDIQPAMLAQLEAKLSRPEYRSIENARLYVGNACALPFRAVAFDLVYMITALPEIPDQNRVLAEVRRVLRSGGILAVTEFFPDPDYPLRRTTVQRGQRAGFELEGIRGSFWTYTVRFRKHHRAGIGWPPNVLQADAVPGR